MKSIVFSIIFGLLFSLPLCAQSGAWSGKIDVGGTLLTIVFNFNGDTCTVDSPDQGAKGIPAEKSYSPIGQLVVSIPSIGATFEGLFHIDMITGSFRQGGMSFPLTLNPGAPKYNRPQTPVQPFPYGTEEVSFTSGDITLNGTLTIPEDCTENTPVVVMVTGTGIQNRDEELFEHKPFAVIADALARAGVASLRYDDRGFGDSSAITPDITTEDFKNDALAGVEFLRKRFRSVGIVGHSEGGTIAFMLAAEGKVDFVVSIAGAIISSKDILLRQNEFALREAGFPETVVRDYVKALKEGIEAVLADEAPQNIDVSNLPEALKMNYKEAIRQCETPYLKYFLSIDVSKMLDKVVCPVLAFNGTLDTQVGAKENLEALRNGLASKNKTIVYVEGCNHLLQHCKTGSALEYREIEETLAPEALELMAGWLSLAGK